MDERFELAEQRCVPCRADVPPLTTQERETLHAHVPQWTVRDGISIERAFKTRNFAEALALVNRIGGTAENEGHHPDIAFGWGYVRLSLQTQAIKGLHANDFILAAKIDRIIGSWVALR